MITRGLVLNWNANYNFVSTHYTHYSRWRQYYQKKKCRFFRKRKHKALIEAVIIIIIIIFTQKLQPRAIIRNYFFWSGFVSVVCWKLARRCREYESAVGIDNLETGEKPSIDLPWLDGFVIKRFLFTLSFSGCTLSSAELWVLFDREPWKPGGGISLLSTAGLRDRELSALGEFWPMKKGITLFALLFFNLRLDNKQSCGKMGLFSAFCSLLNPLCLWCKTGGFFSLGVARCKGGWGRCILLSVPFVAFDTSLEFGSSWTEGHWKTKGKCCTGAERGPLSGETVHGDILAGDRAGRGAEIVWPYGSFFPCLEVTRDTLSIEINSLGRLEVVCTLYSLTCSFEEGAIIICRVSSRWFVPLARDRKGFFVFSFEMAPWQDCKGKIFSSTKNHSSFFGSISRLLSFSIAAAMVKLHIRQFTMTCQAQRGLLYNWQRRPTRKVFL